MIKKKLVFGALCIAMQSCILFPSLAGEWRGDASSGWRYQTDGGDFMGEGWLRDTDGRWYYLDADGYMKSNAVTPDGCVTGADGAWRSEFGKRGDRAVSPWFYQTLLGRGMDVTWSEFRKQTNTYNEQMVADFKQAGVDHVRIRVKDDVSEELLKALDEQIDACLRHGVIPILAYQGHAFKEEPSQEAMNHATEWWRTMAVHFKDISHLLSFDLLIECSDELNKQPDTLNQYYEQTVAAIRETNPDRIIMISPRLRSDPFYLHELKIPSEHNGYLMAEWHFYASGPDMENEKKRWTVGTDEEKQLILDKINTALAWQEQTGIPTWVGAWMPGNFNKGDDYSIEEETAFAAYMTSALSGAGIPFAVNADTKYYDAAGNTWIPGMLPVVQAIFER